MYCMAEGRICCRVFIYCITCEFISQAYGKMNVVDV